MKSILSVVLIFTVLTLQLQADICLPKKDNFYDKAGRGIANIVFSPAELLDSSYSMLDTEGPTVAFTKGFLVQGTSRMLMDIGDGIAEFVTSPLPINNGSYRSFKSRPYDSMVVNDYPPADLKNWY